LACTLCKRSSNVQIALTYCEEYKIKANNTIQLIAEIKDLYVKDELVEKDGFINLSKAML